MASFSSSPSLLANPDTGFSLCKRSGKIKMLRRTTATPLSITAASLNDDDNQNSSTKLLTFLGKGCSGKTTSAVFAAQRCAIFRASDMLRDTDPRSLCLNIYLTVKLELLLPSAMTTFRLLGWKPLKVLLEPLGRLKQADSRLKMTQGVLEGYMYLRNLAEKTDLGRLAGPSLLRLVDEALSLSGSKYNLNGKMSTEIWDSLETVLEVKVTPPPLQQGSSSLSEPSMFGCYLVMDPNIPTSVNSALRYWGCTLQAGVQVSGATGICSSHLNEESLEGAKKNFSPWPFAFIPHLSIGYPPERNSIMLNAVRQDAKTLFSLPASHINSMAPPVKFDTAKKSITLFIPGFDKSEIKRYQCRGGSELVVEAGDQRPVICLPTKIQGKVGGAKFVDRSLVITMRRWDFNATSYYLLSFILVCPRLKLIFYNTKERRWLLVRCHLPSE